MEKLIHEKENSKKWWVLWVVLVICVAVIGTFGVTFCYFFFYEVHDRDIPSAMVYIPKETCSTRQCLEATTEILSSLDGSVNPCEDFYQFTCGNLMAEGHATTDISQFRAELKKNKNIFISSPIRGDEPNYLLLQKTFFQSCINLTAIDESEIFQELLEGIGGWPIVNGQRWHQKAITLETFLVWCKELGLPFQWLFEIKYYGNKDSLLIYPPKLQYDELFVESTYKKLFVEIAVELGASWSLAEKEVTKMGQFARELHNIIFRNNHSDLVIMKLSKIQRTLPMVSWVDFLNGIIDGGNYNITGNDTVIIVETYIRELYYLLGRTPISVQVNYYVWRIVLYFKNYLPKKLRDKFENAPFHLAVSSDYTARFQFCIRDAKNKFPLILEHEFIRWYIDEEKTEPIVNMITYLKNEFELRLQSEDWIDDESKEAAVTDLNEIVETFKNRRLPLDEEFREMFLNISDLTLTSDNPISMITEKNIYDFNNHFVIVDIIENLQEDISNGIDSALAAMPDNLYSSEWPNYLNYGTLGSKLGRKIVEKLFRKAIYENFTELAYPQPLKNLEDTQNETSSNDTKIWSDISLAALLNKAQCLVGSDDIDSEIRDDTAWISVSADFIGVNTAYDAYTKWVKEHEEELKLVALPFSPKQLFWIQYGNANCFRSVDDNDWTNTEQKHINVRHRILTLFRNSENFANDFDCPFDSPMNPVSKCHIF